MILGLFPPLYFTEYAERVNLGEKDQYFIILFLKKHSDCSFDSPDMSKCMQNPSAKLSILATR